MISRPLIAGIVVVIAVSLAFILPPDEIPQDNAAPVVQTSETMIHSLSSVAEHTSDADCWTIVEGKVYDITPYIPRHPGGKNNIMKVCGTDGTALFTTSEGRVHSQNAHNILAGYYIGDLNGVIQRSAEPSPVSTKYSGEYEDDKEYEWEDEEDEWEDENDD